MNNPVKLIKKLERAWLNVFFFLYLRLSFVGSFFSIVETVIVTGTIEPAATYATFSESSKELKQKF